MSSGSLIPATNSDHESFAISSSLIKTASSHILLTSSRVAISVLYLSVPLKSLNSISLQT